MGVTGLWRLLEPAGKPVPLESLENKVLAVDISIWLHQMVKGYQDPRGGIVVNAHLLGLFQRLCKLLHYRIKPVFVFDGGVPALKSQTISKRQSKKSQVHNTVDRMRKQLLEIVTKQIAIGKVISEKKTSPTKPIAVRTSITSPENDDNLFKLPPVVNEEDAHDSDEPETDISQPERHVHLDLHSLDVNADYFKNLTVKEKYDLLTDLKETRKQNSWGKIHELPSHSDGFSDYQMRRLLKRRQVQVSLEEAEKEMGGHYLSLNELEILLNEEGIDTKIEFIPTRQIASDENTRFLLIKDVKEAIENATKKNSEATGNTTRTDHLKLHNNLGIEYDSHLETALRLSLQCDDNLNQGPSTSECSPNLADISTMHSNIISSDSEWETDEESGNNDSDPIKDGAVKHLSLVKAYMLGNSGLTEHEIKKIIKKNSKKTCEIACKRKSVLCKVNEPQEYCNSIITRKEDTIVESLNSPPHCTVLENTNLKDNDGRLSQKTRINNELKAKDNCSPVHEKSENILISDCKIGNSSTQRSLDNCESYSVDSDCISTTATDNEILATSTSAAEPVNLSSDIESEDSFEDVIEEKVDFEICLNTATPPENDIFADIFYISEQNVINENFGTKCTSELTSSKNNEVFTEHRKCEVFTNNAKDETAILQVDSIHKTLKIANENIVNNPSGIPIANENIVNNQSGIPIANENIVNNQSGIPIANENIVNNQSGIPIAHEKIIEDSLFSDTKMDEQPLYHSPKKGMTLNEVRHLVSLENKEDIAEHEPIEKQLISTDELMIIANDLEEEKEKLHREQSKLDRMGRNISEEMREDAQHLLRLFGIPYIIAPMEAEAQCAFLEVIKLTDGTITDDSDIWLFGGRCVYKNFFNQQKYVLQFLTENIKNCFKLSREQLVLLALLVGSDYTTGVAGVGPVTALEILSKFPPTDAEIKPPYVSLLQGLKKFKSWCSDSKVYGHSSLKSKLKNVSFNQDFPSYKVVEAYLEPQVDKNNESFSWGKPDITGLREYSNQKFGWSQTKTDEILKPVLKRLQEKISQQSIRSFFNVEIETSVASSAMSKRVRKAVERMGNDVDSEDENNFKSKRKKLRKSVNNKKDSCIDKESKPILNDNLHGEPPEATCSQSTANDTIAESNITATPSAKLKVDITQNVKPFINTRYQESIPQRESDKAILMKNKLQAIEIFRISKKGPGFTKKRGRQVRQPKLKAELSEESDSE